MRKKANTKREHMPSELTLDQVRDEVARMLGYEKVRCENNTGFGCPVFYSWHKDGKPSGDYFNNYAEPCPASLDAMADLWGKRAEGWTWSKSGGSWHAYPSPVASFRITVPNTGNELEDRYRLLLAVMKHKKSTPCPPPPPAPQNIQITEGEPI